LSCRTDRASDAGTHRRRAGLRAPVPSPKPLFLIPHLPPTTSNQLTAFLFNNIPALEGLSTFVFIDIPGSRPSFPQRSFVFNDIPALLVRFSTLLALFLPSGGDILSGATMPPKYPLRPSCLKCSRQSAVSSRQ
jgi:hypothetical protein